MHNLSGLSAVFKGHTQKQYKKRGKFIGKNIENIAEIFWKRILNEKEGKNLI